MRKCAVCGLEYGFTHACSGIPSREMLEESVPPPGLRFAPLHYFDEAVKMLTWDDAAVRRASRDNNSLLYGLFFLAVGVGIPFGAEIARTVQLGYPISWKIFGIRYAENFAYTLVWSLLVVGFSHGLAKLFFEGHGTYLGVLRAFSLGQLCRWLILSPIAGSLLVRAGLVALLMVVFEEVDGIDRMKAFCLSAAIGIGLWAITYWYTTTGLAPLP